MKVSVLMPAYNAAQYVRAATYSILTQTHRDLELIAIDDGSTDGTDRILEEISLSDPRVRFFTRENRGLVASLNQALDLAQGALIARMDADDVAYPTRLATQVDYFRRKPQLCLLGMGADYLYPGGYIVKSKTVAASYKDVRIESMFHNMFIHPTVMLNSAIILGNNIRYNQDNPYNEDHELWSRLVPDYTSEIVGDTGLAWRQRHGSVRSRHYREQILSSLDLIQRDLRRNGIAIDISIISEIMRLGTRLSDVQESQLTETLQTLWEYRSNFGSQPAFERGFSNLLWNTIEAAVSFNDPRQIVAILSRAGFSSLIGARHKLHAHLAFYSGSRPAGMLVSGLADIKRRLSARKMQHAGLPLLVAKHLS